MKQKWLVTLLSVILVSSLVLAACGKDTATESEKGAEAADTVTLNLYTWINEENGSWEKTIAAYEEANPGVKINVNALVENMDARDYLKKLDLLAASGDKLDLIMFSSSEDLAKRIPAGMVDPLNDYLNNEGVNAEEIYNMGVTPADANGTYYALPMKYNTYLIMMNKDHLDEAGLSVPTDWTWDDYKAYAKQLTTDQRYGSYLHTWSTIYDTLKLFSKGEDNLLIKADGSSNMADPAVEASLQLRYELERVDQSSEPYANIISQKLNYRQQFFTEKASMVPIPSYMVTEWGGFAPEFTIAWAPWPKDKADDTQYRFASSDMIALGKNSEHKEEAYKFMRWMSTEGMLVQNKAIPAWKQTDVKEALNNLVATTANPNAVDIESLAYVLESGEETKQFLPAGYMTEVYNAYKAEVEKYLLGEQELDATMTNAADAVQKVIERNK
ncbi:ABC transporter substrate-binding protein [Paenibacillus apis]|uniref:Sugar ABC transporter substrate-binding protein n=1 Tax=Paenibacillus apis TaxID=1792174 RepID=A0A919Y3A1_9BACL|nr:extracellular solute-binding protein [Paenibacillus apis]GIO41377.1 sugar ABC transporter substrate-binding protein [Paenibacillus apis]